MPMFDYKCPVCGVEEEVYVPGIRTLVYCEDCSDMMCDDDNCDHSFTKPHRVPMDRQSFSSGSRATFDINSGYNANNSYGLRWSNNPSDLKLNPYI